MRFGRGLFALALIGCSSVPFGEVLVVVDSDAPVPAMVQNLRVDLYDADGTWWKSQDFDVSDGSRWPVSFGIEATGTGTSRVRARLRTYPQNGLRDYRGERFPQFPPFVAPTVAKSLTDLCNNAPLIAAQIDYTARVGADVLTSPKHGGCPNASSGAIAMRVHIDTAGSYHFETVDSKPDAAHGEIAAASVLSIRSDCADAETEIACAGVVNQAAHIYSSALDAMLDPGDYTVLTTSLATESPADITLRWAATSDWMNQSTPVQPTAQAIGPRLLSDGIDLTPTSEPQPNLAIDRLVDLDVEYGHEQSAHIFLSSECLGAQANLSAGTSCVEGTTLEPAALATLSDGFDLSAKSKVGSWPAVSDCTQAPRTRSVGADGTPLFDEEICMPGGAFTLGSNILIGGGTESDAPEQVAEVEPFLLDKYEVTVGRYRQALRDGFPEPDGISALVTNSNRLAFSQGSSAIGTCSFSGDASGPSAIDDRERMPLNCVGWEVARDLCEFWGGALPSHAQWEYAATAAGRPSETVYPWGDDPPDCNRAVWGRQVDPSVGKAFCSKVGYENVDAEPWQSGDVTPLGVVGMGGSVSEWTLDSFRPYTDSCWWGARLHDVGCYEDQAPMRTLRGGDWDTPVSGDGMVSTAVRGRSIRYTFSVQGFRCARKGTP